MFRFNLPDCDFSIVRSNGAVQVMPGAHAMPDMTDPHENSLTRGNGDQNGEGIVYSTGYGTPREQDFQFKTTELMNNLLHSLWYNKEKFDFSIVNRKTGDSRILEKCIIAIDPKQGAIEEGDGATMITMKLRFFKFVDKLTA